jgi:lysophospholipase L1-like esterase
MSRLPAVALLILGCTVLLALPGSALAAKRPAAQLYVSLGDSYAVGYQPTAPGMGATTTHGFADQLPALARARGYRLKLVNFGCAGATTTSILQAVGCRAAALAPGGRSYDTTTQARAAQSFIRANRDRIGLITVSIGGNDVTACARPGTDPLACVSAAVSIKANVGALAAGLRRAAGAKIPIFGTTYPDVLLGAYLTGDPQMASLSIVAFRSLINPTLQAAYAAARGGFVDVTAATGAYGSMAQTTTLAPYGAIPTPVAKVCQLTYYCQFADIHARTAGYRIIAQLVAAELPRRRAG